MTSFLVVVGVFALAAGGWAALLHWAFFGPVRLSPGQSSAIRTLTDVYVQHGPEAAATAARSYRECMEDDQR
ncbi:hypothetical protein [Streptomyces sp. NPDC046925]|uniref:hypothetical protein n=1 Tax=Streptomyces sp. NPDC046925 TaxID=3155375 RepID=UPI0033DAE93A